MNLLDNIIDIRISKKSKAISSGGFSTLLIIGDSSKKHRVKSYSNIQEVVRDYGSETNEYRAASLAFGQATKLSKILIGQVMDKEPCEAAYEAITRENNDFYGVMITSKAVEDQFRIAKLVEADNKIFGLSSNEASLLDRANDSNILHKLNELNYMRSFVIYNSKSSEGVYPEAAWFGLMLTKEAGSATWAYKSLSGVYADNNLSANDISTLEDKNGNYFSSLAGCNVMFGAKMVGGEYIDTVIGLDWLTDDLKMQVGNAIIHSEKIAFTNPGIAVIESMIRNSLSKAASRDIIDRESIKVSMPDIRTISDSDKQARILPDVKFEARLAGAIHKLQIQGTISI